MNKLPRQRGQGLLEAVIAIGILLTAIVIIIALSIATTDFGTRSESHTLATNLAREGSEVARQIRDSNWLDDRPFYEGLYDPSTQVARAFFSLNDWNMQFDNAGLTLGANTCYQNVQNPSCACYGSAGLVVPGCRLKSNSASGVLSHSGDVDTQYYRLVFLQPLDINNQEVTDPTKTAEITHLHIISQVYWQEKNRTRTVTLESELYDWQTNN